MRARDIMTGNPVVVTPDESIALAAALMRDLDVGFLPVVNNRMRMRLEGVITDRDMVIRCASQGHAPVCRIREHMTADGLHTVRPDADIDEVIELMGSAHVRRIPVIEPEGRMVGIITQTDIARRLGPIDPSKVEELVERLSEHSYARR
jgi:CBS domain-containing protein